MIMLYLLGQTSAALHARLGASGFGRRFSGLVAGKGLTAQRRLRRVQLSLGRDCQAPRIRDRDEIAKVP